MIELPGRAGLLLEAPEAAGVASERCTDQLHCHVVARGEDRARGRPRPCLPRQLADDLVGTEAGPCWN